MRVAIIDDRFVRLRGTEAEGPTPARDRDKLFTPSAKHRVPAKSVAL